VQIPDAPTTPDADIEAGVIEDARRRQRRQRLAWMLPAAAAAAAGLFFALWGGGSGSTTHRLPGNAEVLRLVEQATAAKPGTIVVQKIRGFSSSPDSSAPNPLVMEEVVETPAGQGPQNYLYSNNTRVTGESSAYGVVNGVAQFYLLKPATLYRRVGQLLLRKRNTVYVSSVWGPYIRKGRKPGTFVYRSPKDRLMTSEPQSETDGGLPPKALTLTAGQAHALLDGSDTIVARNTGATPAAWLTATIYVADAHSVFDPPVTIRAGKTAGSLIAPVLRFPVATLWLLLKAHVLKVVGLTTVDGRRAIELAGIKVKYNPRNPYADYEVGGLKVWVDASTYAPIKVAFGEPQNVQTGETWLEYKTLPITPANQRLLSPLSVHPDAHIDRSYNDYVDATFGAFDPQSGLPQGFP
jgi:hypothetical protein